MHLPSLVAVAVLDGINDGGYGECAENCQFGPYCGDGLVNGVDLSRVLGYWGSANPATDLNNSDC